MKKFLHKIIDLNQQERRQTKRRISANLAAGWSWIPAAVYAHSLRCCAIRSLGNSRRPATRQYPKSILSRSGRSRNSGRELRST